MVQTEHELVREAEAFDDYAFSALTLIGMLDNVCRGFVNRKLHPMDLLFPHGPMSMAAAKVANKFPRPLKLREIALYFNPHGERGFHGVVG